MELISRESVINAIEKTKSARTDDNEVYVAKVNLLMKIDALPPIQPEITHEQAVEYLQSTGWMREHDLQMMLDGVHRLTAQPEIIRCKGCKWWDRYNDNNGYCMAAKSCTYTSNWDIQIRRTYDGDFYCAYAEPKEEYEEDEDE